MMRSFFIFIRATDAYDGTTANEGERLSEMMTASLIQQAGKFVA